MLSVATTQARKAEIQKRKEAASNKPASAPESGSDIVPGPSETPVAAAISETAEAAVTAATIVTPKEAAEPAASQDSDVKVVEETKEVSPVQAASAKDVSPAPTELAFSSQPKGSPIDLGSGDEGEKKDQKDKGPNSVPKSPTPPKLTRQQREFLADAQLPDSDSPQSEAEPVATPKDTRMN